MKNTVSVHILGRRGALSVGTLQEAANILVRLTGSGSASSRWPVADLKVGSLMLAISPPEGAQGLSQDEIDATFSGLTADLQASVDGADLESVMDERLRAVESVGNVLERDGVDGVILGVNGARFPIDANVIEHVGAVLLARGQSRRVFSTVTGRVYRCLLRARAHELGIQERQTGDIVSVKFSNEQESQVIGKVQIGATVTAWGRLRRDNEGRKSEMELSRLEVVDPPKAVLRATAAEGVGLLPVEMLDGMNSVEWVRSQRR